MHGIIFVELKKYVQSKAAAGTWETLLATSGLPRRAYLTTEVYPDEEMVALVTAASSLTGTAIPAIQYPQGGAAQEPGGGTAGPIGHPDKPRRGRDRLQLAPEDVWRGKGESPEASPGITVNGSRSLSARACIGATAPVPSRSSASPPERSHEWSG